MSSECQSGKSSHNRTAVHKTVAEVVLHDMSRDRTEERVNKGKIELTGTIVEALPNAMFRVELGDGDEVLAYLSRRMEKSHIGTLLGYKVLVDILPYDPSRGRIVYLYKRPFQVRRSRRGFDRLFEESISETGS